MAYNQIGQVKLDRIQEVIAVPSHTLDKAVTIEYFVIKSSVDSFNRLIE